MMINSTLQTGVQGLQNNLNGLQQSAQKVASAGVAVPETASPAASSPVDQVTEGLVEMKLYELGAKASAQVVKAGDRALGTLLDTFA